MQQRNIVHWLVETPDTEMVRDTSGAVFRFGVLKSPNEIGPELVEFYRRLTTGGPSLGVGQYEGHFSAKAARMFSNMAPLPPPWSRLLISRPLLLRSSFVQRCNQSLFTIGFLLKA